MICILIELKKVKTKPKAGVKRKYTLRVERTSNAGGTGAAPAIASAEYKPKKKTVAEELEIRYRAECLVQNEFDNKFIAKTIALRPLDYTVNLPTNAFPCKSLLHAIEKSFQDAGPGAIIGLLKEHGYMRNFIGMLCQVYWEVKIQCPCHVTVPIDSPCYRATTTGSTAGF
jgi:hypothetical protein